VRRQGASWIVSLGLLVATLPVAESSEFGNIFGSSDAAQKSRAASAMALQAIEQLMSALRSRELQESTGIEQMLSSANLLRTSADMMNAIVKGSSGEFPEASLAGIAPDLVQALETAGAHFDSVRPETLGALYSNFANATLALASAIEKATEEPNAPIFPRISSTLAYYFDYASLTTRVAQLAK